MGGRSRWVGVVLAACLVPAAPARALTTVAVGPAGVEVVGDDAGDRVVVDLRGDRIEVTASAGIAAGDGCTTSGEIRVSCPAGGSLRVAAGGGDDDVRVDGIPGTVLAGGEGNDRLEADGAIDGGPGDDLLQAGPYGAELVGGPGADDLRGSRGPDAVLYGDHTGPVRADLDGRADDGSPGEGDRISTQVDDLTGGPAADVLVGDARANVLRDGDDPAAPVGGDRLDGAGGGDDLAGSAGDTLVGADGDDALAILAAGPAAPPAAAAQPPPEPAPGPAGSGRAARSAAPREAAAGATAGSPGAAGPLGAAASSGAVGTTGASAATGTVLDGGAGDDELRGGAEADELRAGPGRDTVATGGGDDEVDVRDGLADVVGCRGSGTVRADVVDLTRGCARVERDGSSRALLSVDEDRARVRVDCPEDARRACVGHLRAVSRGRTLLDVQLRLAPGAHRARRLPLARKVPREVVVRLECRDDAGVPRTAQRRALIPAR